MPADGEAKSWKGLGGREGGLWNAEEGLTMLVRAVGKLDLVELFEFELEQRKPRVSPRHYRTTMADVEPIFKKKARSRPTVQRKRALEEEEAPEASTSSAASEVVRVARTATGSPFVQGSTGLRRAKKARAGAVEVDEDEEEDHDIGVSFSARRDEPRRRSKSPTNDVLAGDEAIAEAEKGLYKGEKAYGSQLPKGSSRYGPIKGPENVRTITMMDYKPDICSAYLSWLFP